MNRIKIYIVITFLSLFVLGRAVIHVPISLASQIEAQEEEDDLAAISFENISEAKFEQVPDSIHAIVKNHILQNNPNLDISYAQSAHGQTKGEYIVMVAKHDVSEKTEPMVSYVIGANGDIKKITQAVHLSKIEAFVPRQFHAASKIIAYADSRQILQQKDGSFGGIRARYNQELVQMANEIEAIGLENITEEQARRFYQKRRELGKELKDESGFFAKMGIYARNLWKYQDSLGPTYDSFAAKGISPAEIAVKAVTSGGGDLGLRSNADNPVIVELKKQLQNTQKDKVAHRVLKHDDGSHREENKVLNLKQDSYNKSKQQSAGLNVKPSLEDHNLRDSVRLNNRKIQLHKEIIQPSKENNKDSIESLGKIT